MATRKSSRPAEATPSRPKRQSSGAAQAAAAAPPDEAERSELALLGEQIRYHERAYREGAAEVTDAVFDELMERYSALAERLGVPEGERLDATPGADHTEGFQTVEHRSPMLSLEKLSPARR